MKLFVLTFIPLILGLPVDNGTLPSTDVPDVGSVTKKKIEELLANNDRFRLAFPSLLDGSNKICHCKGSSCGDEETIFKLAEFDIEGICFGSICYSGHVANFDEYRVENEYGCLSPTKDQSIKELEFYHCTKKDYENLECCYNDFCNVPKESTTDVLGVQRLRALENSGFPHLFKGHNPWVNVLSYSLICSVFVSTGIMLYLRKKKERKGSLAGSTSENEAILDADANTCSTIVSHDDTSSIPNNAAYDFSSGSGAGPPKMVYPTISMKVTMLEEIASGRFGIVYSGQFNGQRVAVKVFSTRDESSWAREVNMFDRYLLRHPNVLLVLGSDIRGTGQDVQLWLITEYHQMGSLAQYLAQNVIDEKMLVQMVRSLAHGIAYLHLATRGSRSKPRIAHRDIKRQNVLVKKDFTLAVGDLGLSICDDASDSTENPKAGTIRYLAPEFLNDSAGVCFESFLHADMYALGLVIWEMARRTEYPGCPAAPIEESLAYYDCVERDPSVEIMRECVASRALRPLATREWQNSPVLTEMLAIMRDCWSHVVVSRTDATSVRDRVDKLCAELGFTIEQ